MRGIEDELYGVVALFVSSPPWVQSMAGRLYSMIPTRLRQGSLYRAFAEPARIQDASAVRQLQRQKLRHTLELATRFVPAYQPYPALTARSVRDSLASAAADTVRRAFTADRMADRYETLFRSRLAQ